MRQIIELSHTFNFGELDKVTILVSVTLVFVNVHSRVLTLLNSTHNELLGLLTILVRDAELRTVIKESVRRDTESL